MMHWRSLATIVLIALGTSARTTSARAQSVPIPPLTGLWEGAMTAQGQMALRVVFVDNGASVSGTVDVPMLRVVNTALTTVQRNGDAVHLELAVQPPLILDGRLSGDTITGTWSRGPANGGLSLARVRSETLPYSTEDLTVTNGSIRITGTLTTPAGAGPFPAVVLISGSGAQDRDEDLFGFKLFRQIADALTRKGIAVFRYDDRGVGGSGGNLATASHADLVSDVTAIVAQLKARAAINPKRMGLIGHSEGAVVAALTASRSPEITFVALLAGPGLRGDRLLRQQNEDLLRMQGVAPAIVEQELTAYDQATTAVRSGAAPDVVRAAVKALIEAQYDAVPDGARASLGDRDTFVTRALPAGVAQFTSPGIRDLLSYDPAVTLPALTVPVFAAFGELDLQVSAKQSDPAVRQALAANPRATIKTYSRANHLFQVARTGLPQEYQALEKAFVPGLLDDLAAWILATPSR